MPQVLIQQAPLIGIWNIVQPWQDLLAMFQSKTWLAGEVDKIASDHRKCEWLAVRLLIKCLTGVEIPVQYRANGTPFLDHDLYNISISHTRGYAAVLLTKHYNPGIDIEYRSGRAWRLRTKFLNTKELAFIDIAKNQTGHYSFAQQETLSTLCWCAKETVYKALQKTDVDFINHFHIAPFKLSENGFMILNETKTPKTDTFHIHYQQTDAYLLTWIAGIYAPTIVQGHDIGKNAGRTTL